MSSTVANLRQWMVAHEASRRSHEVVSSGCPALDPFLPDKGLVRGSLVEWLSAKPGSGASILALKAAGAACQPTGELVVIDRGDCFYPPAAAACGIETSQVIIVRPANEKEELWALDQAVRCQDVAAVLAWPHQIDGHLFRRLQLAAERSGCLGLFVRSAAAVQERSWANTRMLVSPQVSRSGWRLSVELLRCGGSFERKVVELEVHDQTGEIREAHPSHLATQLAHPAPAARQARA